LADNIVVLGADGHIIEQGTFNHLRSQDGFVSKLLFHPDLLEPKVNPSLEDSEVNKATQPAVPKALKGPSASDAADLTRQIGDTSVYVYYFKSIGWKISLVNVGSSFLFALGSKFPCE
jgi:ATP-binding cassette subfamily C (CFTR/MRP) protein 1